jgi:hypothetical protein
MKPLKQRLLEANLNLVEDDFATHYSNLYVVIVPGLIDWLKNNYEWFTNITYFTSQVGSNWNGAGKRCIDIPFANVEYYFTSWE